MNNEMNINADIEFIKNSLFKVSIVDYYKFCGMTFIEPSKGFPIPHGAIARIADNRKSKIIISMENINGIDYIVGRLENGTNN